MRSFSRAPPAASDVQDLGCLAGFSDTGGLGLFTGLFRTKVAGLATVAAAISMFVITSPSTAFTNCLSAAESNF
jgi:hypothetical protein